MGDFDGSAAFELINVLKENMSCVNRIFIHTSGLKNVHSFGKDVFVNHFKKLNHLSTYILFDGKNASKIIPEKSLSL